MANPLRGQTNNQPNFQQMFQQFQQNPIQFLTQRKINVPDEYKNNPHGAVQYLLNNGQMTQEQFNQLSQMAQRMGIKLH